MSPRTLDPETARAMAASRHEKQEVPEGWSSARAYQLYLEDADGGRSPLRMFPPPDSTPTAAEVASWED